MTKESNQKLNDLIAKRLPEIEKKIDDQIKAVSPKNQPLARAIFDLSVLVCIKDNWQNRIINPVLRHKVWHKYRNVIYGTKNHKAVAIYNFVKDKTFKKTAIFYEQHDSVEYLVTLCDKHKQQALDYQLSIHDFCHYFNNSVVNCPKCKYRIKKHRPSRITLKFNIEDKIFATFEVPLNLIRGKLQRKFINKELPKTNRKAPEQSSFDLPIEDVFIYALSQELRHKIKSEIKQCL